MARGTFGVVVASQWWPTSQVYCSWTRARIAGAASAAFVLGLLKADPRRVIKTRRGFVLSSTEGGESSPDR